MPSFYVISRRSTTVIVLSRKNIFKIKFCKQNGIMDYSRYCQVSLLNQMLSLANSFLVEIQSYESLRRPKKLQESKVERCTRLGKRIERARVRHVLTRLVMGTIFFSVMNTNMSTKYWMMLCHYFGA